MAWCLRKREREREKEREREREREREMSEEATGFLYIAYEAVTDDCKRKKEKGSE